MFYNRQICESGRPLSGAQWSPVAANGVHRIADLCSVLRNEYTFDLPLALSGPRIHVILFSKVRNIFDCLPKPWQRVLLPIIQSGDPVRSVYECPERVCEAVLQRSRNSGTDSDPKPDPDPVVTPTAFLSLDRRFVAVHIQEPNPSVAATTSQGPVVVFAVNPDRSLSRTTPERGVLMPRPGAAWCPCLVTLWDPARPWRARAGPRRGSDSGSLYLVDSWDKVELYASTWGCGDSPLDQLTVNAVTHRMRVLNLMATPPSGQTYAAGQPVRPKVWETDWAASSAGGGGIRHLEQRWTDAAERRAASAQPSQSRVRPHGDGEINASAAGQPVAQSRLLPIQRAAQRAAHREEAEEQASRQSQAQRPPPRPPDDDDVSDAAGTTQPKPPWASVYSRLRQRRIPRRQRWVAMQLLHGTLPCAAYKHHHSPAQIPSAACPVPAYAGAAANLTHVFGTCSVATAVVSWICDVWAVIEPGNRPPASFAVIAVGDLAVWRPRAQGLWLRLRLQLVFSLWQAADMATPAVPNSAPVVAARIVAGIAAAIRMDWLRASMPAHELADTCGQWMTGAGPALSPTAAREQFASLWCVRDVLCRAPSSPACSPEILWNTVWPVRVPQSS